LVGDTAASSATSIDIDGSFGNRPIFGDHLVVDDVLAALRLFRSARIRAAGYASWIESPQLDAGTSFCVLRHWPYGGFEFAEADIPSFLELWQHLERGSSNVHFSLHRFNLAFERGLSADRIVDLVIAAESLLLQDSDTEYRGEIRFRFRSAPHSSWNTRPLERKTSFA
jgi:hypothetical protein